MRIRILGCSGGIGAGSRTSAMLIDDDVLIDAGTGIGDLSLDEMQAIRHVFLTHAHLDHIAGLPMLADNVFDPDFEVPLTVYALEETLRALQEHVVQQRDLAGLHPLAVGRTSDAALSAYAVPAIR